MTTVTEKKPALDLSFTAYLRDYAMLIALFAIIGIFAYLTNGAVLLPLNVTNVILQNSYIVIMALAMMMVIVAGHIDLSVGSVCGFIGAVAAMMIVQWGWSPLLASLVSIALGAVIGGAQGYLVAYHRIPSFIVTLGGMLIFRGLCLWVLNGASVGPFPDDFQHISSGFISDPIAGLFGLKAPFTLVLAIILIAIALIYSVRGRTRRISHGVETEPGLVFWGKNIALFGLLLYSCYLLSSYRGLPNVAVLMFVLIVIFAFVTTSTTFGRRVYAVGGNANAAKLSGIDTEKLVFLTFALLGILSAIAGLVFTARLDTATPKAGSGFELDVIAACYIGGASASGGVGKVTGAVIGAFVMGVMNNGMSILGIGIDWQQVIKGAVLLLAVFFDVQSKRKA